MFINHKACMILFPAILLTGLTAQEGNAQFRGLGQQQFGGTTSTNTYQRTYTPMGMVGEALIEADYDTRSIIVITDEDTNTHISDIIKTMDHPVPQVLIKVVFLEVTYRDDSDIGLELAINADNGGRNGGVFNTFFGLPAQAEGGFYRLLEDDVELTLRALAEKGKLEVLSRPSILTRNNQEAVITVGKRVPLITGSRYTDEGDTINTIEYQNIGIILRVTPFITQEGLVELILAPEISSFTDESVPLTNNVDTPVFAIRSADTVVRTPNGQTVVIGGMMEDSNLETVTKVPLLGDIPLLGLAFRRKVKNMSKTELLIFLTPYVIEGPESLVGMSQKEKEKSIMIPQAFPEEQLNRFFDKHLQEQSGESTGIPAPELQSPDVPSRTEPDSPKSTPAKRAGANARNPRDSKAVPSRAF